MDFDDLGPEIRDIGTWGDCALARNVELILDQWEVRPPAIPTDPDPRGSDRRIDALNWLWYEGFDYQFHAAAPFVCWEIAAWLRPRLSVGNQPHFGLYHSPQGLVLRYSDVATVTHRIEARLIDLMQSWDRSQEVVKIAISEFALRIVASDSASAAEEVVLAARRILRGTEELDAVRAAVAMAQRDPADDEKFVEDPA